MDVQSLAALFRVFRAQRIVASGAVLAVSLLSGAAVAGRWFPEEPTRPHISAACAPNWGFHPTCWQRFPPVEPCCNSGTDVFPVENMNSLYLPQPASLTPSNAIEASPVFEPSVQFQSGVRMSPPHSDGGRYSLPGAMRNAPPSPLAPVPEIPGSLPAPSSIPGDAVTPPASPGPAGALPPLPSPPPFSEPGNNQSRYAPIPQPFRKAAVDSHISAPVPPVASALPSIRGSVRYRQATAVNPNSSVGGAATPAASRYPKNGQLTIPTLQVSRSSATPQAAGMSDHLPAASIPNVAARAASATRYVYSAPNANIPAVPSSPAVRGAASSRYR